MAQPAFQRRRRGNAEVEDASQGKLGPEFQDAGCLLISEVHLFFSRPGEMTGEREAGASGVAQKTKEYVDEFSRYKEQSTIREVRALLIKHAAQPDLDGSTADDKGLQLSQFEMAQLANLAISDVDEARTLIPTLANKDDAQLESLLNELAAIRKFA
ncbi:RNA polymerase B [Malassezia japonica]|uniref:RNA polymerase B n=1 Tax=Malassezia japonica TaxID=223818 RepID=A0AAF0F4Y5_9BASI|nr:RNA polymerase B [Malassezia japonica]WFD38408.1 RNA polymerase B [Malassezia japonica]